MFWFLRVPFSSNENSDDVYINIEANLDFFERKQKVKMSLIVTLLNSNFLLDS